MSVNRMAGVIALYLRDAYARLAAQPLQDVVGYTSRGIETELKATEHILNNEGDKYFIRATDMYRYLYRHLEDHPSDIVTIVLPGLRDQYHAHSGRYRQQAKNALSLPPPSFVDIWDYPSLAKYYETLKDLDSNQYVKADITEFQLFGRITFYDVVHISVSDFIDTLNRREDIVFDIPDTNLRVVLAFDEADFYDPQYERIVSI